ncbi:hypothetical protein HDV01_003493 [Terramyces sp. JEL0728]|nr:hypothetical protein HDV01_003493 [Terramyces sp. JEL0728]
MAERKAQQKWYPPDFDPEKGSLNRQVRLKKNSLKPMRNRSPGPAGTGKTVRYYYFNARFEMPFNVWCTGCENHIGMGVRYNAKKQQIDVYHSTPVWRFRMKCHLCPSYIEIQTDPKNSQYVITEGARHRIETYDPESVGGYNDKMWKDPYLASQIVRNKFRGEKKATQAQQNNNNQLKDKLNLSIDILPESEQDIQNAKLIDWDEHVIDSNTEHMDKVLHRSIFRSKIKDSKPKTGRAFLVEAIKGAQSGDPFAIPETFPVKEQFVKSSDKNAPVQSKPAAESITKPKKAVVADYSSESE